MTTFYMGNKMFSEIKHQIAKKKKKKQVTLGKRLKSSPVEDIKYTEKTLLSKFFTSCFAAPFTKFQVRKSVKFVVKLKTLVTGICF